MDDMGGKMRNVFKSWVRALKNPDQYTWKVFRKKPYQLLQAGSGLITVGGMSIFFGCVAILAIPPVIAKLLIGVPFLVVGVISLAGGIGILTSREYGRRIAIGLFIFMAILSGVGIGGAFISMIISPFVGGEIQLYAFPLIGLTCFGFLFALASIRYLMSEKVKNMFHDSKEERLEKRSHSKSRVTVVICPYCQFSFQVTPASKPFKVKCPSCAKESLFK